MTVPPTVTGEVYWMEVGVMMVHCVPETSGWLLRVAVVAVRACVCTMSEKRAVPLTSRR